MDWKEYIKEYFTHSKTERQTIYILCLFILLFTIGGYAIRWFSYSKPDFKVIQVAQNSLESYSADTIYEDQSNEDQASAAAYSTVADKPTVELFTFNPNTASDEDWTRLGITKKQLHTIRNYLNKGGSFKSPSDLKKIYGIPEWKCEQLLPYCQILESRVADVTGNKPFISSTPAKRPLEKELQVIELNSADSIQLISLKLIGGYRAMKILNYKKRLGGFIDIKQILEIKGFTDSIFIMNPSRIQVDKSLIKKLNINTADAKQLRSHPYINSFPIANAIVNYRQAHGDFQSIDELKNVVLIKPEMYLKLEPYISIH